MNLTLGNNQVFDYIIEHDEILHLYNLDGSLSNTNAVHASRELRRKFKYGISEEKFNTRFIDSIRMQDEIAHHLFMIECQKKKENERIMYIYIN